MYTEILQIKLLIERSLKIIIFPDTAQKLKQNPIKMMVRLG